jgi:hypothetical protein
LDEDHPDFKDFLQQVCKKVGENARKEAFSQGVPIVYLQDGKLVWEFGEIEKTLFNGDF